jgi:hypothetical protein
MPELRVHRSPWRDFPDVVVQTTIAKLKAHPDYPNAKAGNPEVGIRVVSDLLKPGKVTFKVDAIVPVLQLDANNRNSIPISYAALLAAELKVPVSANVLQINQVSHTGADAASRILGQPIFDGKIQAGTRVLLVDDVVTYGSTIANLRGWLAHQGATVVGCTSMAAAFGGTKLVPPAEVVERLSSLFPEEVQQLADNLGFDVRTFTNREARYLAGIKTLEAFQSLVQASARIREAMRSLSRKIDVQRSWEQER